MELDAQHNRNHYVERSSFRRERSCILFRNVSWRSKQLVTITGEVSKVADDCFLLAKIDDFMVKFNSSQVGHWKRCYLLCVLHQSAHRQQTNHSIAVNVTITQRQFNISKILKQLTKVYGSGTLLILLFFLVLFFFLLLERPSSEKPKDRFKSDWDEICRNVLQANTHWLDVESDFRSWRNFMQKSVAIWWVHMKRLPDAYASSIRQFLIHSIFVLDWIR